MKPGRADYNYFGKIQKIFQRTVFIGYKNNSSHSVIMNLSPISLVHMAG